MTVHESENTLYKKPTEKNFGYTFSIIFFVLSLYLFFLTNTSINFSIFFLLLSIIFFIITFIKPLLLNRLNFLWFKFGIIISKIVNPLILGILFFFIFTPISFWFKIIKRDVLDTNYNNEITYWKKKTDYKSSMKNQF